MTQNDPARPLLTSNDLYVTKPMQMSPRSLMFVVKNTTLSIPCLSRNYYVIQMTLYDLKSSLGQLILNFLSNQPLIAFRCSEK